MKRRIASARSSKTQRMPLRGDRIVSEAPRIERIRHELKRRKLTVARVEKYAAQMVRVVLTGNELEGFTSLGFDDHVKLIFADGAMRDFTPRRFDAQARELWVDFFLHDAGPAATRAAQVAPGQSLEVGGPKGSAVISLEGIDTHVLIGDETAVPAIGRRLEELPAEAHALVVVEANTGTGVAQFRESGGHRRCMGAPRDAHGGEPAHDLIEMLRELDLPKEKAFFWVAVESRAARAISPVPARRARHRQAMDQGGRILAARRHRGAREDFGRRVTVAAAAALWRRRSPSRPTEAVLAATGSKGLVRRGS